MSARGGGRGRGGGRFGGAGRIPYGGVTSRKPVLGSVPRGGRGGRFNYVANNKFVRVNNGNNLMIDHGEGAMMESETVFE
jgi:hypothetical protein